MWLSNLYTREIIFIRFCFPFLCFLHKQKHGILSCFYLFINHVFIFFAVCTIFNSNGHRSRAFYEEQSRPTAGGNRQKICWVYSCMLASIYLNKLSIISVFFHLCKNRHNQKKHNIISRLFSQWKGYGNSISAAGKNEIENMFPYLSTCHSTWAFTKVCMWNFGMFLLKNKSYDMREIMFLEARNVYTSL